jgi:hypothetical protein
MCSSVNARRRAYDKIRSCVPFLRHKNSFPFFHSRELYSTHIFLIWLFIGRRAKKVKFNILLKWWRKETRKLSHSSLMFLFTKFYCFDTFLNSTFTFFVDTHTFGTLNYEFLSRIFMSWICDMGWKRDEWYLKVLDFYGFVVSNSLP